MTWGTSAPDWALPGVEAVAISSSDQFPPVHVTIKRVTRDLIVVIEPTTGQVWRFNADNLLRTGHYSNDHSRWSLYLASSRHVQDKLWDIERRVLAREIRELGSRFTGNPTDADHLLIKINEWKAASHDR